VTHKRLTATAVAERLGAQGIFVWNGNYYALSLTETLGLEPEGMVRIGLLHYATMEEVERLLSVLGEMYGGDVLVGVAQTLNVNKTSPPHDLATLCYRWENLFPRGHVPDTGERFAAGGDEANAVGMKRRHPHRIVVDQGRNGLLAGTCLPDL